MWKIWSYQEDCRYSPTEVDDKRKHRDSKQKANAAGVKDTECSLDSESIDLVVQHAMPSLSGKAAWIIDCGATSHMCNDQSLFLEYESLKILLKVTLCDGHKVDAIGHGVMQKMQSAECSIHAQVVLQSVQCVSDYRT